ncbi:MAG: InlB B-repeat-containing protein [Limisphaerales bacterium]
MLFALTANGQLVESYFPLNNGDQRLFSVEGGPLTMSIETNDDGEFTMTAGFGGSSEGLIFDQEPDGLYIIGEKSVGPEVRFDTPVTFLTESLLTKGGTAKTETSIDDGLAEASISVSVGNAGSVKVLAGTFANCKSIVTHTKAKSTSSSAYVSTSSAGLATTIVAPGVGPIKMEVISGIWAELVNANLGGTVIGNTGIVPLDIETTGTGTVQIKNSSGALTHSILLQIGDNYTAVAKTLHGSVFANWADGNGNVLSTSPNLPFTMESNLVLQANFTTNPFIRVSGRYIGLFEPGGLYGSSYVTNTIQNSGYITLTVTRTGAFSGFWETGATHHKLSGSLNASLGYTNTLEIPGEGTVTIGLSMPGGGSISNAAWVSSITLYPVVDVINYEGAGRYSVQLTSDTSSDIGTGRANFEEKGTAVISGTLPGGPRFSASSTFTDNSNAEWPFYTPLYGGKGYLLGWVEPGPGDGGTDYGAFTLYGSFIWLEPDGSVNYLTVNGSME